MNKVRNLTLALVAVLSLAFTSAAVKAGDIVDSAASSDQFTTLVVAVRAAGLVETLNGDGPFIVFAPNNEVFAALPAGTVENLLKPENEQQLVAILTYHVLPGRVMSDDIAGKTAEVATVQGSDLSIDATSDVLVDGAHVITADIITSNGVIHVIDKV